MTGRTMALYWATNVSVVKPQLDPARAFMTLRALVANPLDTIAEVRAKGEMGEMASLHDKHNYRILTQCCGRVWQLTDLAL